MRRRAIFQYCWAAAALLAGAGTAAAQTQPGKQSGPPAFNWGSAPIQKGSTTGGSATTGSGRPLNIGLGSPGSVKGGTRGGSVGGSAGFGLLLTPEQRMMVILETVATVEALIDELGLQFENELELLFLVLMIYEVKYQEAVQGVLGGVTGTGAGGSATGG